MFFVLSGFVLARPFLTKPGKIINIPAFYVRRIIRIWLPWFFVFLASLAARQWLKRDYHTQPPASDWLTTFWHQPLAWKDLLKQCFFLQHDSAKLLIPQDWSLGIELKGSALIPVFLIMARHRVYWLWLGISSLLFFLFIHNGSYYISFIVGVLLAKYSDHWVPRLKEISFRRKLALLALGVIGYESRWFLKFFSPENWRAEMTVWLITSLACALIIFASLSSRRISGFLVRRPLVFAGKISYSVYLIQSIVQICFIPAFVHWLNHFGVGTLGLFSAALLSSLAVTLALAWVIYYCVELPSVTLGHWLSQLISPGDKKHPRRPAH